MSSTALAEREARMVYPTIPAWLEWPIVADLRPVGPDRFPPLRTWRTGVRVGAPKKLDHHPGAEARHPSSSWKPVPAC